VARPEPGFTCAALVPVGCGAGEIERTRDLIEGIAGWEPALQRILLLDDSVEDRDLVACIQPPRGIECASILNPRLGHGYGYLGGLCSGVLTGLQWIHRNWRTDFTLKIDTDGLVIAPFVQWLGKARHQDAASGLFGTVGVTSNRNFYSFGSELHLVSPLISALESEEFWAVRNGDLPIPFPLTSPDDLRAVQTRDFGLLKPHLRAAIANGYRSLHFCQGGAYVVSRFMTERMQTLGFFNSAGAWTYMPIWEDVALGMYAHAAGFKIRDVSNEGEPFASQWSGLAFPPEDLIAKGHSVIHSVKDQPDRTEKSIRKLFSGLREDALTANPGRNWPTRRLHTYSMAPKRRHGLSFRSAVAIYAGPWCLQSFAALSQIRSLTTFYKNVRPDCDIMLMCPFRQATASIAAQEWCLANSARIVLFSYSALPAETLSGFGLEELLDLPRINVFHRCGDCASEATYEDDAGPTVDRLLNYLHPRIYIISGLRATSLDVVPLTEHINRWEPHLIGCRERETVELLCPRQANAFVSGTDALDEYTRAAGALLWNQEDRLARAAFAFQASLAPRDICGTGIGSVMPDRWQYGLRLIQSALDTLVEVGTSAPVFVNGTCFKHEQYADTWSTLARSSAQFRFPAYTGIELASSVLVNRLDNAVRTIASLDVVRFVGMSFHTGLFFRSIGIPTFMIPVRMCADCVSPIAEDLHARFISELQDFVRTPVEELRVRMAEELRRKRTDRADWTAELSRVVTETSPDA
jgi:hypothetical protein